MAKRVYSLVLSDEVVAEADRLARRLGTNRSGLINHILAEYLSCSTSESTVRDIFSAVEELLGAREVFRVSGADTRLSLRSSLDGAECQCDRDGSFRRTFHGSYGSDTDAAARRISAYVGSFDSALKRYFALLDDPAAAESEVRRIYGELAGTAGGKASY